MVFKSLIKVRNLDILLKLFRTFIQPTLHSLEFVDRFSDANLSRYDYLVAIFLGIKVSELKSLYQKHSWLSLEKQLEYAKIRYNEF